MIAYFTELQQFFGTPGWLTGRACETCSCDSTQSGKEQYLIVEEISSYIDDQWLNIMFLELHDG